MVKWPWRDRDEKGRFRRKPAGYLSAGEYGDEFAVEPYGGEEEEDFVEGEFREIPSDARTYELPLEASSSGERSATSPQQPIRPTGSSIRDLRARREAAKRGSEIAETEKAAKKAQAELEILRAERARVELSKAKRESRIAGVREVGGYAGRIAQVFSPSLGKKEKVDLYFGKAKGSLYVPPTPTTTFLEEIPAKRALQPHIEKLRRAGAPASGIATRIAGTVAPPTVRPGQSPLNYGFLREASRLKSEGPLGQLVAGSLQGGSRLEQLIFAAIRENNDQDTIEHVKDEVERLGYKRSDIEAAVRSLQQQGFVEKQGRMLEVK